MSLDLEQCRLVQRAVNNGWSYEMIAKKWGINRYDVTLIVRCNREKYPLDEYHLIDSPTYPRQKLDEPMGAWDVRLSMKLAKLPMSQWAAAL